MIDSKTAEDLVTSVFSFDYVGDSMMQLRRNLSSEELRQCLVEELVEHAASKAVDSSAESREIIYKAAVSSVLRFVEGSKAAKGTGCGG